MPGDKARSEVRLHERGCPGWVGPEVLASLPEPVQCLAVAQGKGGLQARTILHLGQVQDSVDQASADTRGEVPGRGAQRRPGGSVRFV